MIVYFLRHANAGHHVANEKVDQKRPLDADGISQCGYIGRACAALNVHVDAIISSPLKRALQTASLVGTELGYDGKIIIDPALLPMSDYAKFRDLLGRHSKLEAIMLVGHNPSLSELLARFVGTGTGKAEVELKKCALAKVETAGKQNTLEWLFTPKIVRSIYESATPKSRPKTPRK